MSKIRIGVCTCLLPLLLWAQTGPVDLTELSLEDLLHVKVVPANYQQADVEQEGWIVGFQYIEATYEDYSSGSQNLKPKEVLSEFPVVPNKITQCAHIVKVGKRLEADRIFLLKIPFLKQSTDHIRRTGDPFKIETEGLGDISALYSMKAYAQGRHQVRLTGGLRFPTGAITETGDTPRGKDTPVPYTMQLGSGTFDVEPLITYVWDGDQHRLGFSGSGTIRLGRNSRGYSLSDWANVELWSSLRPTSWLEVGAKVRGSHWTRIDGKDDDLDPTLVGVADGSLYGGDRVVASGLAKIIYGEELQHILSVEGGVPVYQHLNGPQPKLDYELNINYTVLF